MRNVTINVSIRHNESMRIPLVAVLLALLVLAYLLRQGVKTWQ